MKQFILKHKPIFVSLTMLLLIYMIPSILISEQMNKIVKASNADLVDGNSYAKLITNEDFERLCYRNREALEEKNTGNYYLKESMFCTPVVTVHWFVGAKSYYIYSYEISNQGEVISGSRNVPITITSKFQNGKWVVTKVFEPA